MAGEKGFSWNDAIEFAGKLTAEQREETISVLAYGELVGVKYGLVLLEDIPEQQLEKGQVFLVSNYE